DLRDVTKPDNGVSDALRTGMRHMPRAEQAVCPDAGTTLATRLVCMSELRVGVPLWLALERHPQRRRYQSLNRDIDADVVIVGGGLTGAVLALTFARAGIRVVVLEGDRVGHGSTAANSALLMYEPDMDFGEMTKWYGAAAARRIWRLCRQATRAFTKTLQDL